MSEKKEGATRRDFLKLAGATAPAAVAAVSAGAAEADEADTATASGYRLTPHIEKYLELARF